jgi:hypothetical protein
MPGICNLLDELLLKIFGHLLHGHDVFSVDAVNRILWYEFEV